MNMEKVINGLEIQLEDLKKYADNDQPLSLTQEQAQEIIALLKEQEPKPVIFDRQCEVEPGRWERKGFCPKCHQVVLWIVNREHCGFCGQAVKWNE